VHRIAFANMKKRPPPEGTSAKVSCPMKTKGRQVTVLPVGARCQRTARMQRSREQWRQHVEPMPLGELG
jgi:hypothetical protein